MPWFRATRRRARPLRLGFDNLESRRLLSGSTATPVNASFDSLIGAAQVRQQQNVDGSGLAAAVIDTGADYNNPALGGGFGSGFKAEAGYDFAQNDPYPLAETWSHGTMVSGLIASNDPTHSGVAPGADLVPLRVIGNNNQGSYNMVADALQWVVDNHAQYHISVVNISLSDGGNYTSDPFLNSTIDNRIRASIAQLKDLKIPVVCASGNSFDGSHQGMGYTAILSDTISVTGTDPQNHFVSDAQRLGPDQGGDSATDLAAPGAGLVTTSENNTFTTVSGTSFAAPLVSGAVILLQQIYESRFGTLPSVSDLVSWLKQGSDPITDPATGITIGKLDIPRAAALIPQAARPEAPPITSGSPPTTDTPAPPPTTTEVVKSTTNGPPGSTPDTSSKPPVSDPPSNPESDPVPPSNPDTSSPAPKSADSAEDITSTSTNPMAIIGNSPSEVTSPSIEDGQNASTDVPPTDPPASATTPISTGSSTSSLVSIPVAGPPGISMSSPSLTHASPFVSATIRLAASKHLASLEVRNPNRFHAHQVAPHSTETATERLILMKALRERRQLFRLARAVSGR